MNVQLGMAIFLERATTRDCSDKGGVAMKMYNWGMRGDGKGDNFHNGLEIVSITTYPCK